MTTTAPIAARPPRIWKRCSAPTRACGSAWSTIRSCPRTRRMPRESSWRSSRSREPVRPMIFHKRLYRRSGRIDTAKALATVADMNFDRDEIAGVAEQPEVIAALQRQLGLAASLGFVATPSFLIAGRGRARLSRRRDRWPTSWLPSVLAIRSPARDWRTRTRSLAAWPQRLAGTRADIPW